MAKLCLVLSKMMGIFLLHLIFFKVHFFMRFRSTYLNLSFFYNTYLRITLEKAKKVQLLQLLGTQVGSDKEKSKGWVGSGSGNAKGRPFEIFSKNFRGFHLLLILGFQSILYNTYYFINVFKERKSKIGTLNLYTSHGRSQSKFIFTSSEGICTKLSLTDE